VSERSEQLKNVDLFAELPDDRRAWVADRCNWRTYEPDSMIFSQGDGPGDVYFLTQGTVRASIYSASGKNVIFQDMQAGCVFGEISALDDGPRSASIESRTQCLVASLPAGAFADVLRQEPDLALQLLRKFSGEMRRLSERVVEFSTLSVRHRVHAELYRLAAGNGDGEADGRIKPTPSLSDIADRISTHREAVSRELSRLTKNGLVIRKRDSLHITDMGRLEELIREASPD